MPYCSERVFTNLLQSSRYCYTRKIRCTWYKFGDTYHRACSSSIIPARHLSAEQRNEISGQWGVHFEPFLLVQGICKVMPGQRIHKLTPRARIQVEGFGRNYVGRCEVECKDEDPFTLQLSYMV